MRDSRHHGNHRRLLRDDLDRLVELLAPPVSWGDSRSPVDRWLLGTDAIADHIGGPRSSVYAPPAPAASGSIGMAATSSPALPT